MHTLLYVRVTLRYVCNVNRPLFMQLTKNCIGNTSLCRQENYSKYVDVPARGFEALNLLASSFSSFFCTEYETVLLRLFLNTKQIAINNITTAVKADTAMGKRGGNI